MFTDFTERKEEKNSILVGIDNPLTVPELKQEYGIPLGFRGIGQGFSYLANFKALSKYNLKKRLITKHEDPIIQTTFFGNKDKYACTWCSHERFELHKQYMTSYNTLEDIDEYIIVKES